jgi:hypothetical protein
LDVQHAVDVRLALAADMPHSGTTAAINIGPLSLVVDRPRNPISFKAVIGTARGDNWFDPTNRGTARNLVPLLSTSTTYDPNATDIAALRRLLDR